MTLKSQTRIVTTQLSENGTEPLPFLVQLTPFLYQHLQLLLQVIDIVNARPLHQCFTCGNMQRYPPVPSYAFETFKIITIRVNGYPFFAGCSDERLDSVPFDIRGKSLLGPLVRLQILSVGHYVLHELSVFLRLIYRGCQPRYLRLKGGNHFFHEPGPLGQKRVSSLCILDLENQSPSIQGSAQFLCKSNTRYPSSL